MQLLSLFYGQSSLDWKGDVFHAKILSPILSPICSPTPQFITSRMSLKIPNISGSQSQITARPENHINPVYFDHETLFCSKEKHIYLYISFKLFILFCSLITIISLDIELQKARLISVIFKLF